MKTKTSCLFFLFLLVVCGDACAQVPPPSPIITTEQIASAFNYTGKLKVEDQGSQNGVLTDLSFYSEEDTFVRTDIKVESPGKALPEPMRDAFDKLLPKLSADPRVRCVTLKDGAKAYLLEMAGRGGQGYTAWINSQDGKFDLEIGLDLPIGFELQKNSFNKEYYKGASGSDRDKLDLLASAIQQIYPIIKANYDHYKQQYDHYIQARDNE